MRPVVDRSWRGLAAHPRRRAALRAGLVALVLSSSLPALTALPESTTPPEPNRRSSERPLEFRGSGRDAAEPKVDEVVLGWFGPGEPDHPEFGDMWRGAELALEQENAAGGYGGKPFRLVPEWSESPWKAGVVGVNRLVYERGAWAVLGGVDGTSTHLAVQLALKSFFLLLSPGSTDPTADHANVPWLFSLPPSDDRIAPDVADALASEARGGSFVLVAGTDHDSHAALQAVRRVLSARRLGPQALHELPESDPDLPSVARETAAGRPKAVLVLARAPLAGRLVAELRAAGYSGSIVGGPTLGRNVFARAAGEASEGVFAPVWVDATRPQWRAFAEAFSKRWQEPPDAAAAGGYDAMRLAAAAIRKAGLNRPRIRDAVRALAPWAGVGADVRWDARGRNEPVVRMARWHAGRLDALVAGAGTRSQPGSRP